MADMNVEADSPQCELYLITPSRIDDLGAFSGLLDQVLEAGDVACVQLRLKEISDDDLMAAAKKLMPICHQHGVAFLVNDRADIAVEVGADGVHLGQHDGDVKTARTLMGHEGDIGVTCHDSMHLAFEAGEAGADYVAFGAFFDTPTKDTEYHPSLDILTTWGEVTDLPCVAIGGITVENCQPVIDAGAHFIAVSSGVWAYPDGPVAAIKAFKAKLSPA